MGVCCTDPGDDPSKFKEDNPSYSARSLFPSEKTWVDDTLTKLHTWGFNSLAGWSDYELFRKHGGDRRIPYFLVLHLGAYDRAPWHDLFAPDMEKAVDDAAKDQIAKVKSDPYLVGYFSDNELGWWDDTLFYTYLKMPVTAPGKRRMMQVMRKHYGFFAKLRRDWITPAKSYDELAKLGQMKIRPGGNGGQFVNAWTYDLGVRYYSLMRDAIRRYDKTHLILGDRYCQYYTLPIVLASRNYIDVASTNFGSEWNDGSISRFFLDTLHRATGKPIVVSEFYMCAMQNQTGNRNSSGGFPIVETQEERAKAFKRYVESVASLPYMLGAHWFQFYDEPPKGRGDGEDYNMGLVDVAGRPYVDLTRTAASLDIAALRKKARLPVEGTSIPPATAQPMKGLKEWPRDRAFVASATKLPFGDLYVTWDKDALYVGLIAMDYMDESLYEGHKVPEGERSTWNIRVPGKKVTIRFGGAKRTATCSDPNVQIFETPALKHVLIAKIPIRGGLAPDMRTNISSDLSTHSRRQTMSWQTQRRLAN